MKKIIAVLAGFALALAGLVSPAAAAPAYPASSTHTEVTPSGAVLSVKVIDNVASYVTVTGQRQGGKVSLLTAQSSATAMTKTQCTGGYICFWDTPGYLGNFYRYNQTNIAAVGCYNMTVASNNASESFYNNSGYSGALHNWVNCNSPSGRLVSGGTTARGVYMNVSALDFDGSCSASATFNGSIPCDWATSIYTDPMT